MNRALASRIAAAQDRERERLTNVGLRQIRPLTVQVRADAIRALLGRGGDVQDIIRRTLEGAAPLVADGMLAAHLQGRLRSFLTAQKAAGVRMARKSKIAKKKDTFDWAQDFLARRLELPEAALDEIATRYHADARVVVNRLITDVQDHVGRAMAEAHARGLHVRGGVEALRAGFDAAGITPKSDFALETIFRTQNQVAYAAGRWNANQDESIDEILWGYEYSSVGDDRVRPSHAALDGWRAPKDDPQWRRVFPPNGWNCRCTAIEIFKGDAEAVHSGALKTVRIDGARVRQEADEGFAFNAGVVYRDLLNYQRGAA